MSRWEAIDERAGLYALEKTVESGWCWRALAVRCGDGASVLVSPIRGTLERSAESLDPIGKPALALAPNHFHHLGLREARERYGVACAASSTAAKRLQKQHGRPFEPLDAVRERLPAGVTILEPPGTKTGEVWLRVETDRGVAWAVCDAFFSVENELKGMTGLALRATGTAPGLRIGSTFLWLALADRRAYRKWLEAQLEADAPRVLIPSHGAVVVDDALPDRLRALAAARL